MKYIELVYCIITTIILFVVSLLLCYLLNTLTGIQFILVLIATIIAFLLSGLFTLVTKEAIKKTKKKESNNSITGGYVSDAIQLDRDFN